MGYEPGFLVNKFQEGETNHEKQIFLFFINDSFIFIRWHKPEYLW
ncbi:MAG: hypothetical protein JETT_2033 [Candidatus Jettenia ecosi]|uniref:Uncharacterized protein n=1 Tax=Candidatus Jettenia ecosi TaxID=2494326 RepID=A0A533QAG5_9BACT|nr:MAG: hypothetical protein JETT_2033 [Candidatus Jettenia ecosi]